MDRRTLITAAGTGALGLAMALPPAGAAQPAAPQSSGPPSPAHTPEGERFQIGMIIFDQMTNLDFAGPCDILSRVRGAKVNVLAKTTDPVTTDAQQRVLPQMRLADAPKLDMLFVPGGPGSTRAMEDPEILDFLRSRAPQAQWITSVCTGALVLGAAGLLKGYRAATHWTVMDLLPLLGATPVKERVVIDRNRVTGGGVTAGIDFALTLIGHIWGEDQAKLIQLANEYNPHPPYDAGSPDRVPEIAARYIEATRGMKKARTEAAQRASARIG